MTTATQKKFTQVVCVAVSSNANSFGLRKALFLTRAGAGFAALANALNVPPVGARLRFEGDWGTYATRRGWECSELLPPASPKQAKRILTEIARRRSAAVTPAQ